MPTQITGSRKNAVLQSGSDAQVVVAGLPDMAYQVAKGRAFQVKNATGLDNLTALPTTTAGLSLWNAPASGVHIVVYSFGSSQHVVDATQENHTALFAMSNVAGSMAVPTDAALAIASLSGTKYAGQARTLAGGTVTDNGWFPHVAEQSTAGAVAGAKWKVQECAPGTCYVIAPGGMFSIVSVQLAAVTASQFYFMRFLEIPSAELLG